jgi:hypothetical protein
MTNLVSVEKITLTEVGVIFSSAPSLDELETKYHQVAAVNRGSSWALGDILAYTEWRYGEVYSQWMDISGLSYGRLANLKSLCQKVPYHIRKAGLSISHHEAVSAMPVQQQGHWLCMAEENGWSREELRDALRLPEPNGTQTVLSLRETVKEFISAYDSGDAEGMKQWIKMIRTMV